MKYFMRTERLGFRHWTNEDNKLAIELWGNLEVTKFIGGPFSEKHILNRLAEEIQNQNNIGISYWPFFSVETNAFIGCCGLKQYNPKKGIYKLGFHLLNEHWGKSFGKEAADAVINRAFNTLGAEELFAGHHPKNMPSKHLLKKLGFEYTHDELFPPTGLKHPSYILKKNNINL